MPISEALIVSAAVGAAMTGLRPVASMSFVEFTLGAMDEIVNQAAKLRYMSGGQVSVPLVLRASDGVAALSAGQHSGSLEALFTHIAGLKVVAPSNPADAKGLLRTAIADDDPVIFLENKSIRLDRGPVPEGDHRVPIGMRRRRASRDDVTLVTYSVMAVHGEQAVTVLAEQHGISAELIDLRPCGPSTSRRSPLGRQDRPRRRRPRGVAPLRLRRRAVGIDHRSCSTARPPSCGSARPAPPSRSARRSSRPSCPEAGRS